MNYYSNIKNLLIDNEIKKKVKNYTQNKNDLDTYYNVGRELALAGKHYGEGIIKKYSSKLTNEIGKGYTPSSLKRFRQFFYYIEKGATMSHQLSWSHYCELLPICNINRINYYIKITEEKNLSIRELRKKIKNNEYDRLDEITKNKLIYEENAKIQDFVMHPIIIKNNLNVNEINEKILKQLILEDIDTFLNELGFGFCYVSNEYKIKVDDTFNYIDLLLFNIKYNCYVVVELKVTPLKKEHIGQIEVYMNYIDKNIKSKFHNSTIGIIITKENNKYVIEYSSNPNIINTTYIIN